VMLIKKGDKLTSNKALKELGEDRESYVPNLTQVTSTFMFIAYCIALFVKLDAFVV